MVEKRTVLQKSTYVANSRSQNYDELLKHSYRGQMSFVYLSWRKAYLVCVLIGQESFPAIICHIVSSHQLHFFRLDLVMNVLPQKQ